MSDINGLEMTPSERLADKRSAVDRLVGPDACSPNPAVHSLVHHFINLEEDALLRDPALSTLDSSRKVLGEIKLVSHLLTHDVLGSYSQDEGTSESG